MAPIRTEDWKSPHIPCALVPFLDVAETAGNELAAAEAIFSVEMQKTCSGNSILGKKYEKA